MGKEKITQYLLNARIQLLDSNWKKFFNIHELLISNQKEEFKSQEYFTGDFYSNCEDAYLDARAEMLQMREHAANRYTLGEVRGFMPGRRCFSFTFKQRVVFVLVYIEQRSDCCESRTCFPRDRTIAIVDTQRIKRAFGSSLGASHL